MYNFSPKYDNRVFKYNLFSIWMRFTDKKRRVSALPIAPTKKARIGFADSAVRRVYRQSR